MRNLLLALLLTYLPFSLSAQLDDLLKNPGLSYVATFETEHDFRLNRKESNANLQLTKFTFPEGRCMDFDNENWLANWILEAVENGKFDAYQDAELSNWVVHSTLMNRISSVDTVITFDPATYEERVQVIKNKIIGNNVVAIRTHQALYFDKKTGSFGTRLLAIAPMIRKADNTGKVIGTSPIAWLAIKDRDAKASLSLQNPDIIWSALLIDRANDLEISQLKVRKNEWKASFAEQLYQEALGMKHPVESSGNFACGDQLTKAEIVGSYNVVDTIITFDPETYKETIQVSKGQTKPQEVKKIRLAQDWFWDDRRKILVNKLRAIGPIVEVFDQDRVLMYNRTQYYIFY